MTIPKVTHHSRHHHHRQQHHHQQHHHQQHQHHENNHEGNEDHDDPEEEGHPIYDEDDQVMVTAPNSSIKGAFRAGVERGAWGVGADCATFRSAYLLTHPETTPRSQGQSDLYGR